MTMTVLSSQNQQSNNHMTRRNTTRVGPERPQNLNQEQEELIHLEDYQDDPECIVLGGLKTPPLSSETECFEIGQLQASPTMDSRYSRHGARNTPGFDQSRQEMVSLADAALDVHDERDGSEPAWDWEHHQSAWYGCFIDMAGEAAELFNEGFIGDGNHIHALEMRGSLEASKEAQLKRNQKKDTPAKKAAAQQDNQKVTSSCKFPVLEIAVPSETNHQDLVN